MTKPLRTQFVVLDGARARWIRRSDASRDLVTENEMKAEPYPAPTSREGMVFQSGGPGRHAVEERVGPAERSREAFVERVAEALNAQAEQGAYERLAIVAPSRTLNALTAALSPTARSRLSNTLAKDLTKAPDHELGRWLRPMELR
jgi:protein required for attachment to host cells